MRAPSLVSHVAILPASAWRSVHLDRSGPCRNVKVVDEEVHITDYPGSIRRLVVKGMGSESPTVIITNGRATGAKQVIESYAGRLTIEQRLSESIRFFNLDALCGAVPLNVDLDVVLSMVAVRFASPCVDA
ncbi:MAG: hypothetical protein ACYDEY_09425 [Acidimicrobiales bacterium]